MYKPMVKMQTGRYSQGTGPRKVSKTSARANTALRMWRVVFSQALNWVEKEVEEESRAQ